MISPPTFDTKTLNPAIFVRGKRPAARDGHGAVIVGEKLFIFGGDRHHMPFNDLYLLDLQAEFKLKHNMFK
jgi:hypothetical protein